MFLSDPKLQWWPSGHSWAQVVYIAVVGFRYQSINHLFAQWMQLHERQLSSIHQWICTTHAVNKRFYCAVSVADGAGQTGNFLNHLDAFKQNLRESRPTCRLKKTSGAAVLRADPTRTFYVPAPHNVTVATTILSYSNARACVQGCPQNWRTFLYDLHTLPNINRFSKLFHSQKESGENL